MMHIVMGTVMNLELFSLACVSVLTIFFSHEVWRWLKAVFRVRFKHSGDAFDPAIYFVEDSQTLCLRMCLQLVLWDCVDIHEMRLQDFKEELKEVNTSEATWVLQTQDGELYTGREALYRLCALSPLVSLCSRAFPDLWARKDVPAQKHVCMKDDCFTVKPAAEVGILSVAYRMIARFCYTSLAFGLMVMMCVTSYEVVTFNGPATIRFLLESLSRYYCRKYPLQDFSVVASMQKYNLTDLNNGLTQLGNITLWSKSCADHDGSGGVPKKQPHDHKTHWGPALNWYKGLPKPEDEKDNKLPASVVTPESAASNPTCYPPRYLHLHPRA